MNNVIPKKRQAAYRFACIAILILWIVPGPSFAQSANLVQNGGFESGLSNWSYSNAGGANGSCSIPSSGAHSGSKCAALTYTGTVTPNVYGTLTQTISGLTVGNTYGITLWCQGTQVGGSEQIAAGSQWQFRASIPSGSYGWTSVSLTFVADAATMPLIVLMQDTTSQLLIDDVTLSQPSINMVSCPSVIMGQTRSFPGGLGIVDHNIAPTPTELQMIRGAGFNYIRVDLPWQVIEQTKGVYNFTGVYQGKSFDYNAYVNSVNSYGMKVYFILDYVNPNYDNGCSPYDAAGRTAFKNFALAAVRKYRGKGVIWEIYNEPNNFWTFSSGAKANAQDAGVTANVAALYAPLAVTVAQSIKRSYPNEVVVGLAMGWLDSMTHPSFDNSLSFMATCYQQGICQYVDGISVHPYRDRPEPAIADYFTEWNAIINSSDNQTGKFPALVSGEWGYSSSRYDAPLGSQSYTQAEQTKAIYLSRSILLNMASNVNFSVVYEWMNGGTDQTNAEFNFGLVSAYDTTQSVPTITPLEAYNAVKTLNTMLAGYTYSGRINMANGSDYVLSFTSGSKMRYVCWNEQGTADTVTVPAMPNVPVTVTSFNGGYSQTYTSGATGGFYCGLTNAPQYIVAANQ